jgi:hypothetical protein
MPQAKRETLPEKLPKQKKLKVWLKWQSQKTAPQQKMI